MAARLLLALAVVASSWWVLTPRTAEACSCAAFDTQELVAMAEFVVLGTVVQVDLADDQDLNVFPYEYNVKVAVNEYLKGSGPDQVVVQDFSLQGSACSPFDPDPLDQEFLLFLNDRQGHLRTSTCAGSGRVGDSEQWQEHIEEIRQIVSEQEQPGETPELTATPGTPQLPGETPALTATPGAPQLPATGSGSSNDPLIPMAAAIAAVIGLLGAGLLLGVRRLRSS